MCVCVCVCVFVYMRGWVGGWMDGYVFLIHSRPACACECSRRGHYSILVPAWLHLGGQWDSDLSTRRTTADGWTPTSLSRLVLFTVLMFLCFILWLQECYSVCEYKSVCVCVSISFFSYVCLLCVCVMPLCQGWLQSAAPTVDASFNRLAARPL